MFGHDRNQMRQFFRDTWRKRRSGEVLSPLEALVADVVAMHPEYHDWLESRDAPLDQEFHPEGGIENPFLHLGLHVALREQLGAGRPAAVRQVFQRLLARHGDPHTVEHRMIECIGQTLWQAQRSGAAPDEQAYLECLRRLSAGQ